jgi:hypothetical protein
MARPVYSTGFLTCQHPVPAGTYLVPPGDTAIVTHMTLYVATAGAYGDSGTALQVALDYGNAIIWRMLTSGLPAGIYQWTGREVFYNYLQFDGGDGYSSFRANGYVLTAT